MTQQIALIGKRGAGRSALVDDGDFALVSAHRWYVLETVRNGHTCGPYAQASIWDGQRNRTILMHCLIMGTKGIDHVNHDGLDNTRANLRPASTSQNGGNSRKRLVNNAGARPSSVFKGVKWQKKHKRPDRGYWVACIGDGGTQRYLGSFKVEKDAALAYDAAARERWGEFALLNFPGEVAVQQVARRPRSEQLRFEFSYRHPRAECPSGHKLTPDNLRGGKRLALGKRECLTCHREQERARYRAKAAAA